MNIFYHTRQMTKLDSLYLENPTKDCMACAVTSKPYIEITAIALEYWRVVQYSHKCFHFTLICIRNVNSTIVFELLSMHI